MLFPIIEFGTGLLAASAVGRFVTAAAPVAAAAILAKKVREYERIEALGLSKFQTMGDLGLAMHKEGMRLKGTMVIPDLKEVNFDWLPDELSEWKGLWYVDSIEEMLLTFYLARETYRRKIKGGYWTLLSIIEQESGIEKEVLCKRFFFEGEQDSWRPT
jgi:hypothetical protein